MSAAPTGWKKVKRGSLLYPGATEVAFSYPTEEGTQWMVVADHTGVVIRGESPKFTSSSDMQGFAEVVGLAMREYQKLKSARIVVRN